MILFREAEELTTYVLQLKSQNKTIGFVPTMGALHKGHLSLANKAKEDCDFVIVSIFVNPTQFNNQADLKKYPKTLDKDIQLLKQNFIDAVFFPEYSEVYPDENSTKVSFDFAGLDKVMEGKHRPGHFNGVAMVVKRLFEISKPDKAYFGQKDFQQFTIVNYLNNNYLKDLNIQLIKCPIIRESDGLAMSSRNSLLTEEQRKQAVLISQTLFEVQKMYMQKSINEIKNFVKNNINKNTDFRLDYFEIVDDYNLQKINDKVQNAVACIAVKVTESLRLIDNVCLTFGD